VDEFVLKEKELALKLALHPWILGGPLQFDTTDAHIDIFNTFVCIFLTLYLYFEK